MKKISTHGITNLVPLEGSTEWYFGIDYASGDLYEAEELFKQGHPINCNKLEFVHYPDGAVTSMPSQEGQYWGLPIYYDNHILTLLVDFSAGEIKITQFNEDMKEAKLLTMLPLSDVEDCYNLLLRSEPPMLTRQASDNKFQILWPERVEFITEPTESFYFRIENKLYFSAWYEDPNYRDEVIIREVDTGKIIERFAGTLMTMPDGQVWILS